MFGVSLCVSHNVCEIKMKKKYVPHYNRMKTGIASSILIFWMKEEILKENCRSMKFQLNNIALISVEWKYEKEWERKNISINGFLINGIKCKKNLIIIQLN